MTITYTLTADDIVESKRRRLRFKPALVLTRPGKVRQIDLYVTWIFLTLLIGGSMLIFVGGLHLGLNETPFFLFMPLAIGVMWLFFVYVFVKALGPAGLIATFNKDERNAGPFTTEVRDSGITHVTPGWTAEIEWSAIHSVWETKNLLLIIDDTPRVIAVPKRAFASPADQQRFLSPLKQRLA